MKLLVLSVIAVSLLSSTLAYAENPPIGTKVERGGPELLKACGITELEAGLQTDMQKFKAVYKKYEERDSITLNKQTCGIELALRALELGKKVFPENGKNLAHLAYNYSVSYREANLRINDEAIIYAVDRFEAAFGKESAEIIPVYEDACIAGIEDKQNPKDLYCTRAIKLSKKINGGDSLEYADTILNVSSSMLTNYRYHWEDNKEMLLAARNILVNKSADKDFRIARIDFSLGKLQASLKHHETAIKYYEQALLILDQPQNKSNNLTLTTHAFMVESLEKLGMKDEATKHCLTIAQILPAFESKDMQPLFKLAPEYPREAIAGGAEGTVFVEFGVDESGNVVNPAVTSSTVNNKALEKASLEAVKKYRYAPRIHDGKPVATEGVKHFFSFSLQKLR